MFQMFAISGSGHPRPRPAKPGTRARPLRLESRQIRRHRGSSAECHKPPLRLTRPHAGLLFPRQHITLFCLGPAAGCVTELLRSNVSSVTRGAIHEFGMAGAVKVLGLVKSARVVVVSADARERHQYRGVVLALPLFAETVARPPGSVSPTVLGRPSGAKSRPMADSSCARSGWPISLSIALRNLPKKGLSSPSSSALTQRRMRRYEDGLQHILEARLRCAT
jgi:hypothetical protein